MSGVVVAWIVIVALAFVILFFYGKFAAVIETEVYTPRIDTSVTPNVAVNDVEPKQWNRFLEYYAMPAGMLIVCGLLGAFIGAVMLPTDLQHTLHGLLDPAVPVPVEGTDFTLTKGDDGITTISLGSPPADDLEWVIMHEGKDASMYEKDTYQVPEDVKEVYLWFYRKATRNPGEIVTAKVE